MPTLTTNYSLNKPLVNNATDQDLWGGYLNTNMDTLDTTIAEIETDLGEKANLATNTFSGAQIGGVTSLTSSSNSVAIDMSLNNNFSHTLTENTTLANPTNAVAGQSGQIAVTQHASAAKTLAFGNKWIEVSGSVPVISTTLSAQNLVSWYCADANHIWFSMVKNGQA